MRERLRLGFIRRCLGREVLHCDETGCLGAALGSGRRGSRAFRCGFAPSESGISVTKRENGDVVLAMATAADAGAAQLDVTVVIHPDGRHELENFSLEAPKATAGVN